MKKIIALAISLLLIEFLSAQEIDWQHYHVLQAHGKIPDDFTELSSAKYQSERKEVDESAKKRIQKSQDLFYLKSNFVFDEVLHSGRVVFGDRVTGYLNSIKDVLLKDNPEVRDKIRIYTYRSSDVNAFTTNSGIVLVTTGLISQVENEAELAFILSHEFNHYIKKHALIEYVERSEMSKGRGIYRNLNQNDIELASFQYSKDLESEADKLGLELFEKSNYSLDAAQRVFDVLLYSYLPFDEVEFKKDFFNEGNFQLPEEYFLEKINPITAVDDYDDSKNTHPNIKTRRSAMISAVEDSADTGRKSFIVSENEFKTVQKICRYEECLLHLNDCEFEAAFYNSYLLLQEEPENIYLKKVMTRALYGASSYKNYFHSTDHDIYYNDVEGESEQVYYLFDKIPKKELNVLALKYAWQAHLAAPDDQTIKNICRDLAFGLVDNHSLSLTDFKDHYITADSIASMLESKPATKVEKIKSLEHKNSDLAYWKFGFVNYMKDDSFKKIFTDAGKKKESRAAQVSETKTKKRKHDYTLGIDEAVIVDPLYLKVDERSRDPVKYVAAEQLKLNLKDKINTCAQAASMNVNYLDRTSLAGNDIEKFNDLALLNNWISEELDHEDVPVINSGNEDMEYLTEKYKTDHFVWIGVVNFHEKKEYVAAKVALSVVYFPVLPYTLVWAIKPKYDTVFFTMVANGKSGEFEMEFINAVRANDVSAIQKSNLFYIFQQMKTKAKS